MGPRLIIDAYYFAEKAHKGQKRKSGEDYITHPSAVANLAGKLNADIPVICACYLHDIVEDTKYTLDDIRKKFGEKVSFLVDGLTKEKTLEKTIKKIETFSKEDSDVIFIKMMDVFNNIKTAIHPETGDILIDMEKYQIAVEEYSRIGIKYGYFPFGQKLKKELGYLEEYIEECLG